jgi:hypothetical protein
LFLNKQFSFCVLEKLFAGADFRRGSGGMDATRVPTAADRRSRPSSDDHD